MQPADLDNWIKQLPAEEVRAEIRDLEVRLDRAKQALALYESLSNGGSEGGTAAANQPSTDKPSKPAAIAAVLRDHDPEHLAPGDIWRALVERAWIQNDTRHRKRFYSTMSRLTGEGRIVRHGDGAYTLPPNSPELR